MHYYSNVHRQKGIHIQHAGSHLNNPTRLDITFLGDVSFGLTRCLNLQILLIQFSLNEHFIQRYKIHSNS